MREMIGAHPYRGVTAAFATKHFKESVVAPAFATLEISVVVPEVDTDQLGTFTGEIHRVGTPKEVVLKKARLGIQASGLLYGIASEGSIGPDVVVLTPISNVWHGLIPQEISRLWSFIAALMLSRLAQS